MSKKTIQEQTPYEIEVENNERKFKEMLKRSRPDLFVLMDVLDETEINWFVVIKIIRQLKNIADGTGYGTVSVEIQNHRVIFVNGQDRDRLDEPLIKKRESL